MENKKRIRDRQATMFSLVLIRDHLLTQTQVMSGRVSSSEIASYIRQVKLKSNRKNILHCLETENIWRSAHILKLCTKETWTEITK